MAELRKLASRFIDSATGLLAAVRRSAFDPARTAMTPAADQNRSRWAVLRLAVLRLIWCGSVAAVVCAQPAASYAVRQDHLPSTPSQSGNAIRIPQHYTENPSAEYRQDAASHQVPSHLVEPQHGLGWRTVPIPMPNVAQPMPTRARNDVDRSLQDNSPQTALDQALWNQPAPFAATSSDPTQWSLYQSNFDELSTINSSMSLFDGDANGSRQFWEQPATMLQTQGGDSAYDYPLDEPTISSESGPGVFLTEEEGIEPMPFQFNNLARTEMLRLLMPSVRLSAEYIPEVGGYSLANYAASTQIPTYPFFGPPPPFISAGFAYHDLTIPMGVDLPSVLYEIGLGASWIRKMPNGWFLRASVDGVFASDFENQSSDAWQLRGGLFTLITLNPQWQLTAGTLVTGREDIPVIPAAGVIWTPSYDRRVELMLPRPRIAQLVIDGQTRQQWVYVGAGFGGGTFAYEQAAHIDDVLTYREWRAFLGWEFIPRRDPGQFRVSGLQLAAELGYVFGRSYEFESGRPDIDLGDAAVFRLVFQF